MQFQKEWLRIALKKKGYPSIYAFCKEHPSLHNHMLYGWNSMRRVISVANLMKLCYKLDCTPNELLLHTEEEYYYV